MFVILCFILVLILSVSLCITLGECLSEHNYSMVESQLNLDLCITLGAMPFGAHAARLNTYRTPQRFHSSNLPALPAVEGLSTLIPWHCCFAGHLVQQVHPPPKHHPKNGYNPIKDKALYWMLSTTRDVRLLWWKHTHPIQDFYHRLHGRLVAYT